MDAEIRVDADGRETLRLPREILEGAARVAVLEGQIAELRRQLAEASPASARIRLGMDAAARDQIAAMRADMTRGQDEAAKIGAQIAEAIRVLASAVAGIVPVINLPPITPTFAPVFAPDIKAGSISVEARVQLPPPKARKGKQTNPDGTVTEFEISGG